MKLTPLVRAIILASGLLASLVSARAGVVISPGYSTSVYQSGPAGSIIGFDWDASNNLYYTTATPSFQFGGLYQGSNPTPIFAGNSNFPGASVATVGGYVYFNDGNYNLYTYNPTTTLTGSTSAIANYALFGHSGKLFITGSGATTNNAITYSNVGSGGALAVTAIEQDNAYSGPLAFDSAGNLFYAPGYDPSSTNSIFEWSAAQVSAAIADPVGSGLVIGNSSSSGNATLWDAYGTLYNSYAGGTSLVINNNQLYLSLTNFGGPSALVAFGMNSDSLGTYSGTSNLILSDDASTFTSLGQLGLNNGNLYIADGNQILQIQAIPEPSSIFLLAVGLAGLLWLQRRRARRPVSAVAWGVPVVFFSISTAYAGPFSPAADQPGSTGVAAGSTSIQEWANGVANFNPGPVSITNPSGAKANFGVAANALGASDSTQANPNNVVSLGDGGSITLTFATPIANGPGADFAVFENGFPQTGVPNSYFLELATVAVSSDGVNFFTFPSVSLTQTSTQVASFGTLDPTNLYNLAGSEIVGYGTPFNLDDLAGVSLLLNINNITQVRVTDAIGNINTGLGTGTYTYDDASNPIFNGLYGTSNHLINDPYPTAFSAGGFDLDAIGVLNTATVPEPSTLGLFFLGLIAMGTARSLFRRNAQGA